MHLIHLTSAHGRYDTRILHKECASLVLAGHRVTLVVADGRPNEVVHGVEIRSVLRSRNRLARMLFAPWRVFREARRLRANLYHLHDPELIPMGLVLRCLGARVVFDAHENLPKQVLYKNYLPRWARPMVASVVSIFMKLSLPHLSGLVAAEPLISEWLRPLHPRTVEIKNFPIMDELAAGPREPRGSRRSVCYIGALSRVRGIGELVRAANEFPEGIELVLAGNFEDEKFHKELQNLRGWDRTRYLGVLDRVAVQRVLTESLAGMATLHPTPKYMEAYPTKVFEYWSAGLPVVISDFHLWRELAANGACGFCVNPMDPEGIARAVRQLVENPALAEEMGQKGRAAVQTLYTWEREAATLRRLVEELTNELSNN